MPRWLWFSPLALITVLVGLWAFRLGWIAAHTTETEVINHYAQKYLADRSRDGTLEGASVTDCVALPGEGKGIWLHIVCGPSPTDGSRQYEYEVNRFGKYIRGWNPYSEGLEPGSGPRLPET